jgi:signal transduction histidine kinase
VFDRFKQLDEKINSINTGHGLGLSIVQTYTEMLDGTIAMKNNSDGGLLVELNFPEKKDVNNLDDLDDFLLDSELIF